MIQTSNPNHPLKNLPSNQLCYLPGVHSGYTQGGAWLRLKEHIFWCPANPIYKINPLTNQPSLQALSFEDEEKHVYELPLENFQILQTWLTDPTHFQRWTSYPLTAWQPEDVDAWQTQSILDWTLDEVLTLLQILDTIRYTDEAELQTSLPPLLNYLTYESFAKQIEETSFLNEIQFN